MVQTGTVGVHAASLVDGIKSEIAERMLVARIFKAAKQGGIMLEQVYESVIENEWFDWVRFPPCASVRTCAPEGGRDVLDISLQ